jgi:hypothetical protein
LAKQVGKSFTIISTNPKMASTGMTSQRYSPTISKHVVIMPTPGSAPWNVAVNGMPPIGYAGPVVNQPMRETAPAPNPTATQPSPNIPTPAAPAPAPAPKPKTGLEYDPYDTTLEEAAKAPTVFRGQAPKMEAMPDIAKPADVKFYGEEYKSDAQKLANERQAAYERRLSNAAIRSGNAIPTIGEGGKVTAGAAPVQTVSRETEGLQQLKTEQGRRAAAPSQQANAVAAIKDSKSVYGAEEMRNKLAQKLTQGKVIIQQTMDEYLKKQQKDKR